MVGLCKGFVEVLVVLHTTLAHILEVCAMDEPLSEAGHCPNGLPFQLGTVLAEVGVSLLWTLVNAAQEV